MKSKNKKAVLAFVPVLHKGYIDFFSNNNGDIWVFGPNIVKSFVHLTRDLRTMEPKEIVKALRVIFPGRRIDIAEKKSFKSWPYGLTIMPDDEVSRDTAQKYLKVNEVKYADVFLRWNRVITFKEFEVPADRRITKGRFHREILAKAYEEAKKSSDWWRQIGTFALKDGKILFKAHNHHLPTDFHLSVNGDPRSNFDAGEHQDIYTSIHSEAEVIAKAAREGVSLRGSDLYVTTFPCPNCARLIGTAAGISRVYYSKGYSLLDAEKILKYFGVKIILVQ